MTNQQQRILSFDAYDFEKSSISRGAERSATSTECFRKCSRCSRARASLRHAARSGEHRDGRPDDRTSTDLEIHCRQAGGHSLRDLCYDRQASHLCKDSPTDKDTLSPRSTQTILAPHVPRIFLLGKNYGRGDPYTALDMLTQLGQYLDGIPGRKNLIWVAGQFDRRSISLGSGDPPDLQAAVEAGNRRPGASPGCGLPVNVRGVVVNPEGALTGARPNGGASNRRTRTRRMRRTRAR